MPNRLQRLLTLRDSADAYDEAIQAALVSPGATVGVESPAAFHPDNGNLNAVVWADLLGGEGALTRAAVMAIPAHARQRHLLCGTIARCPLRVVDGVTDTELPPEARPLWAHRTDGLSSPWHRMMWTIDDLIHYGVSVWSARRASVPGDQLGGLLSADRIPVERWGVDPAGRLLVDGVLAESDDYLVIPGPHEGVLNFGAPALRRTIANLDAAANAARNPSAYLELHYTGDDQMSREQIDDLVARWAAARRGENSGVAFTNKLLEVKEHGTHEAHLLIEGRNADAVDVSRMVSSPAAMADATAAGASLTYETTQGRNGQFIDYGVQLYMDAVAARLSMDDVVPRGQRVAYDTTQLRALAPAPTGERTDD